MNDFKHTHVGDLPLNWTVKHFGDIVAFRIGRTPPRNHKRYWDPGEYPWVSIGDMKPFATITKTSESVSEDAHKEIFRGALVPEHSMLMSFKLTIGRVARLGIPAYHNEAIISFQPDPKQVDADYLYYYLAQIDYADYQDTAVKGLTLNKGKLSRLEIVLPPLPEQSTISALLGLVQRAIAQQERQIILTTELKRTLLHRLFTQGLHGGPQKQTDIGPIPEKWGVIPLGQLARIGNGSTPKRDKLQYWEAGNIPWLNSAKIHETVIEGADQFVTDVAVKECHLPRVAAGSLLIAITGQGKTLGNSALVTIDTCINQHLAYATFHDERILPEYALWYMQTRYEHLRSVSQAGGSTKGALTCGYLKTYPVPIPPMEEQRQIVTVFKSLRDKITAHERKLGLLSELFHGLLHTLMTAQIRVNAICMPEMERDS